MGFLRVNSEKKLLMLEAYEVILYLDNINNIHLGLFLLCEILEFLRCIIGTFSVPECSAPLVGSSLHTNTAQHSKSTDMMFTTYFSQAMLS